MPTSARLDTNDMDRRAHRHSRAPVAAPGETTATLGATANDRRNQTCGPHSGRHRPPGEELRPTLTNAATARWCVPRQQRSACGGSLDLGAACAGFVYEFVVGASMLSTGYEHVLIVGSETLSRITDPEDRSTVILFGDGAAAAVLARSASAPACSAWDLGCDGSGGRPARDPFGRRCREPASAGTVAARDHYMAMQGQEVFRRGTRLPSRAPRRCSARA